MKRIIVIMLIIGSLPLIKVEGQNQSLEKLNAYKIAFFTRRLNLTPKEAERFWPVYNELQAKKLEIQKERLQLFRDFNQNGSRMSEKDITDTGDRLAELDVLEGNLAAEYHAAFKKILPPIKVLRLYQAENQYRVQLLNELRENRPLRENVGRGPLLRNN
jgi:hypothetical protein